MQDNLKKLDKIQISSIDNSIIDENIKKNFNLNTCDINTKYMNLENEYEDENEYILNHFKIDNLRQLVEVISDYIIFDFLSYIIYILFTD